MRTLAVLLVIPVVAWCQDGKHLLPRTMELGQVGPLWKAGLGLPGGSDPVRYTIAQVGDDWLAIEAKDGQRGKPNITFLVRGVPTKGLVDDREWKPQGTFKVEKTEKYKGKTVFVLEAQKD